MKETVENYTKKEADSDNYKMQLNELIASFKRDIGIHVKANVPTESKKKRRVVFGELKAVYSYFISIQTNEGQVISIMHHDIINGRAKVNREEVKCGIH